MALRRRPAESEGWGRPIWRNDCVAADRPPLGHVILVDGEWVGRQRDRRTGSVVWVSDRLGSLEAAKAAVETHLSPELVSAAANMNRPEPLALAA